MRYMGKDAKNSYLANNATTATISHRDKFEFLALHVKKTFKIKYQNFYWKVTKFTFKIKRKKNYFNTKVLNS